MSANLTPFRLPVNHLAQIGGSALAPTVKPTFAAAVALDAGLGIVQEIDGDSAVSATCTVTPNSPITGVFGQILLLILKASGVGTVTYTIASPALPTATVAPTTGKAIVVGFVWDGTNWREFCRSASAQ